jgi:hypothetical protein|nr:MAG TPA: hypothetical protein [Caudoviricetes sp.]
MSISDAMYNNMLEEKRQAVLRSEYKSIRACPLKEVNGRVDNYTEEQAKTLLKMMIFDRR